MLKRVTGGLWAGGDTSGALLIQSNHGRESIRIDQADRITLARLLLEGQTGDGPKSEAPR